MYEYDFVRLNLGWLSDERLLAVCDEVAGFFAFVRRARATLEEIRAGLQQ